MTLYVYNYLLIMYDLFPCKQQFLKLRDLACGRPHDIYAQCQNIIGTSAESVRLEERKTLGDR